MYSVVSTVTPVLSVITLIFRMTLFFSYLAGTADDRQYHVMTEREKWIRVVMCQQEVAKLIPESEETSLPLPPEEFQKMLVFDLGVC